MSFSHARLSLFLCWILAALPAAPARGAPSAEEEPPRVQAHVDKGYKHLRRQRYSKAIEELERARELSAGPCIRCLEGIAMAYYRSKQFEHATRAYEELLATQPGLAVLRRLILLYERVGTLEKSISAYRTFLESSTDHDAMIPIYNELGVRHLTPDSGLEYHRNDAAAAFRAALDLAGGRSNQLRRNLAEALWRLGAKEEASAVLDGLTAEDEMSWRSLPGVERTAELRAQEREIRSEWFAQVQQGLLSLEGFTGNVDCSYSSGDIDPENVRAVGGDVRKPEKISAPQPQYTETARKRRVQGVVVVQTIIDEWGCVRATRVIEGLADGLTEEAVKAIRRWRFRPATLNDVPVAVHYNLTVNFRLQ